MSIEEDAAKAWKEHLATIRDFQKERTSSKPMTSFRPMVFYYERNPEKYKELFIENYKKNNQDISKQVKND